MSARTAALLVLVLLAGCGGSDRSSSTTDSRREQAAKETGREQDSGGEEGEKGGLDKLAIADRHAFVQIATAASDLNTGASLLLVHGITRPQDSQALRRLVPLVRGLSPRDPTLRSLRAATIADLRRAIQLRAHRPGRRAARTMLADAARIRAGLKRYSTGHPAIGGVAPD